MTLPTFLVIGAMKAGTTSLYEHLRDHPEITMSRDKEPDFFVVEKTWSRGVEWYEAQFPGQARGAVGEASTSYAKHPLFQGVPERAAACLPGVRLVYVVRDPLARMRSQWRHALSAGWEHRSFARAVDADPQYLDISRYAWQLDQWLPYVPAERIHVMTAESLRTDPDRTLGRVFAFLGVDPDVMVDRQRAVHTSADMPPRRRRAAVLLARAPGARHLSRAAPVAVRRAYGRATTVAIDPSHARLRAPQEAAVLDALRPDVARLREHLGADFDGWGLL